MFASGWEEGRDEKGDNQTGLGSIRESATLKKGLLEEQEDPGLIPALTKCFFSPKV